MNKLSPYIAASLIVYGILALLLALLAGCYPGVAIDLVHRQYVAECFCGEVGAEFLADQRIVCGDGRLLSVRSIGEISRIVCTDGSIYERGSK